MTTDAGWVDSMPARYDRHLGPVLFEPYAQVLARRVAEAIPPPARVLELAAGTGIVTRALRGALGDGAHLTATDLNPAMLDYASARGGASEWRQADAQQLPFADGSFDAVACAFGAMFFPDKVGAYAEARRVLTGGGRLVLTLWDRLDTCATIFAFEQALAAVLPDRTPDFVRRIPHAYFDDDTVRGHLADAGFADSRVEHETLTSEAESARSFARGVCQGTPLRFALAERGDVDALTEAVAARLEADLGPGPVRGPMSALVVEARRAA